jgi:enamine deaminase RidA (YjgF/YER057c/UK114 family)
MKIRRNPDSVHPPLGAYGHQVEAVGERRLLAIAGQVGMTRDGRLAETASDQLAAALENVRANLEAASMTPADVVKLTIFLTEEVPAETRGRILTATFGSTLPAITLVYVSRLAAPTLKAEVEALASAE